MSELTCRELVELVTDYLEDALPGEARSSFERHIRGCDGCSAYLEQFRATIEATGRLTEEDLSEDARESLLAVFRAWKAER